jgi:ATP-dependent DNA ligase
MFGTSEDTEPANCRILSQNEVRDITSGVHLPVNPPVLPMLAKRVGELPHSGDWVFEPKWDEFRALVFRDGDEILIQSRDAQPLLF